MRPARGTRARGSSGSIVVEAAFAIPMYMFVIFLVAQLTVGAVAQAKVQTAVNLSAVEISQALYVKGSDVGQVGEFVVESMQKLSQGALGQAGDDANTIALVIADSEPTSVARKVLRKHLVPQGTALASYGLVDGADGVTFTSGTSFENDDVKLEAEYTLRYWFFGDHDLEMKASATTARWRTGEDEG